MNFYVSSRKWNRPMQASFVSPSVFFTQLQGAMLNTSQVVTVRATNATSIHRPRQRQSVDRVTHRMILL